MFVNNLPAKHWAEQAVFMADGKTCTVVLLFMVCIQSQ